MIGRTRLARKTEGGGDRYQRSLKTGLVDLILSFRRPIRSFVRHQFPESPYPVVPSRIPADFAEDASDHERHLTG